MISNVKFGPPPPPLCALFFADAITLSVLCVIVPNQRDDPHDLFVVDGAQTDHYVHWPAGCTQLRTHGFHTHLVFLLKLPSNILGRREVWIIWDGDFWLPLESCLMIAGIKGPSSFLPPPKLLTNPPRPPSTSCLPHVRCSIQMFIYFILFSVAVERESCQSQSYRPGCFLLTLLWIYCKKVFYLKHCTLLSFSLVISFCFYTTYSSSSSYSSSFLSSASSSSSRSRQEHYRVITVS